MVACGALALTLAGAGAGIAAAQTTTPPTAPSAPTDTAHQHKGTWNHKGTWDHHGEHRGSSGGMEHGEFTLQTTTGDKVIDVQRGVVTVVSATSVTVKSPDNFTATYALDAATKVTKDHKESTVADVAVNDQVRLEAVKTATADTVQRLQDSGPGK